MAFLVSNFWADSSFGSVEVAIYDFVCGMATSDVKTQVYVKREGGGGGEDRQRQREKESIEGDGEIE